MSLIYHLFTVLLLVINIAGLTAVASRWLPSFALARAAGILLLTLVMFFIEHFVGLGSLAWAWPLTTILAGAVLYIERKRLCETGFAKAEMVFGLAFAYGLAWKFAFPIIYPTSERVTDLYFIGNYLPGNTLPPLDHWFPPNKFDFYYAFQHYAAALMGRIFGMGPGLTYNISFALIMALPVTLAWDFATRFIVARWRQVLLVVAFTLGGTGATPFVHLTHDTPANATEQQLINDANDGMWSSQRFIGLFDQQAQNLNTELGRSLFPKDTTPGWEARELPSENFGYQYYVGDYHPPLGGFYLLLFAIALIGAIERRALMGESDSDDAAAVCQSRLMQALLAMTVPVMIATNTWVFPLQAFLVMGWIAWRYSQKDKPDWAALWFGGLLGFALLYPFLTGFAAKSLSTPMKLVQSQDHTPLRQFLALHWPLLLFVGLGVWQKQTRRITLMFAATFGLMLLFTEMIYVDDPTGGRYERTNSVMKWWGFIWTGAVVALGALLLGSQQKVVRIVATLAIALTCLYSIDVARYWIYTNKDAAGKLDASSVYTTDANAREMFRTLKSAPYGIVLENWYGDAYTDSGIYAVFSVKPSLMGWPSHLMTWHGNVGQAWALKEQIRQFYLGTLANSADWLLANKVQYIVWSGKESPNTEAWKQIQQAIGGSYAWHEYFANGDVKVGLWIKR